MADIFMTSLEVRADFAVAAIFEDEDGTMHALFQAECVGYRSHVEGESVVPALFGSVPDLKKAWFTGWATAEELAIADCTQE